MSIISIKPVRLRTEKIMGFRGGLANVSVRALLDSHRAGLGTPQRGALQLDTPGLE